MEQQKLHHKTPSSTPEEMSGQPGGGGLMKQAQAYGDAARAARQNCKSDEAAERELLNRRNRSGQ